ncbi:putative peptidoglycan binding domain-containing protein [Clostridium sporogenes]|nr:peptidoglycan-binding protein [Clostridium botulinum]KRU26553.1 putative peptidoglycan-binding protein [Clostridium sporogenes]KRU28148.1 putative peptidoglycan binding domain-containing protein [Clostridium sporogenes]KRU29064.1 putative peptidoglycan binding domain-containing protein [Clostridium sporogenes]KRU39853.1 hypothetical protein VT95_28200 [Clostridium sporogenes]MBZ1329555.1 peptidoglycan-binding protein [Clostridium botulinum]
MGRCESDGYFGDGTLLAVRCLQRNYNFIIDGVIGENT